ncbi:MAG: Crp/Fnr family transcriptional regulator [Mucilaginibacter sp.]|uniref:Crp/Fnr family transcriptional regulator n=1 Tax=Mucilaginibacter sp. TaxID=1882438 RepID=UPI003263FE32
MLNQDDINFYLTVFKELSLTDIIGLFNVSKNRTIKAGEIYINQGSESQKLAYIKSGLIRTYYLKENGDEITLMLRWENQFIASADSVIFKQPSRFIYQALEDTTVIEVDYQKAQAIIDKSTKLSSSRHTFLLNMLGQAIERIETFVLLSAEERYIKLLNEKPDINNRVPDKYLATMLGITPVSLSRIRKRITLHPKH